MVNAECDVDREEFRLEESTIVLNIQEHPLYKRNQSVLTFFFLTGQISLNLLTKTNLS